MYGHIYKLDTYINTILDRESETKEKKKEKRSSFRLQSPVVLWYFQYLKSIHLLLLGVIPQSQAQIIESVKQSRL